MQEVVGVASPATNEAQNDVDDCGRDDDEEQSGEVVGMNQIARSFGSQKIPLIFIIIRLKRIIFVIDVTEDFEDQKDLEQDIRSVDEHEAFLSLAMSVALVGVFQAGVL